jgi:hypothetical protein
MVRVLGIRKGPGRGCTQTFFTHWSTPVVDKGLRKKLPSHRNPQRFGASEPQGDLIRRIGMNRFEAEKSLPFSTTHTRESFHKLRCEKQ